MFNSIASAQTESSGDLSGTLTSLLPLILIAGIVFIVIWSKKRGQQQNDPQPRQMVMQITQQKICPMCAERVQAAALICHFCGYKFTPEELAAQRAEQQNVDRQSETVFASGWNAPVRMLNPANGYVETIESAGLWCLLFGFFYLEHISA